ncbi:MAG: hypothetical protein AAF360_07185 [Pseudomonadota bacterium]
MNDFSPLYDAANVSPVFEAASSDTRKPSPRRRKEPPLSIRMTAKEKAYLKRAAGDQPVSRYVRSVLFDDALTTRQRGRRMDDDRTSLAPVLSLLGRSELASSLRALASAAECGALPVTDEVLDQLRDACADVRLIRRTLLTALGVKTDA